MRVGSSTNLAPKNAHAEIVASQNDWIVKGSVRGAGDSLGLVMTYLSAAGVMLQDTSRNISFDRWPSAIDRRLVFCRTRLSIVWFGLTVRLFDCELNE